MRILLSKQPNPPNRFISITNRHHPSSPDYNPSIIRVLFQILTAKHRFSSKSHICYQMKTNLFPNKTTHKTYIYIHNDNIIEIHTLTRLNNDQELIWSKILFFSSFSSFSSLFFLLFSFLFFSFSSFS